MNLHFISKLKINTWIIIFIFLSWVTIHFYLGIVTPVNEGDSVIIHVPIAEKILDGTVLVPNPKVDLLYPGGIEIILAAFILINIPLGLFNVFGVIFLFFASFILGKRLEFGNNMSIIFGVSVAMLHGVIRWTLTQKPDVWMLAFFTLIIWLILKKNKTLFDYLLLGVSCGFFIGSKFTGPVYLLIVFIFFSKQFFSNINPKKIIAFLIPTILLGASWYIRNMVVAGVPVYLSDYAVTNNNSVIPFANHAWKAFFYQPILMATAHFSEFMLWILGLIVTPIYLIKNRMNNETNFLIFKFYFCALLIILVSFTFPYRDIYHQMVGTMRYTLPMIVLIMSCIFLIFKKYNLDNLIAIAVIPTLLVSTMTDYHPKILLIIVPVLIILYLLIPKNNNSKKINVML